MNFSVYLFTYLLVYELYTVLQLVDTNNDKNTGLHQWDNTK